VSSGEEAVQRVSPRNNEREQVSSRGDATHKASRGALTLSVICDSYYTIQSVHHLANSPENEIINSIPVVPRLALLALHTSIIKN
jgi:hypothetical protein